MKEQVNAIAAEIQKNRHSKIIWVTFAAFAIAPVFGGIFMLLMQGDGLSGAFKIKAELTSFQADWNSFLSLLSQAVGVGGILIFGFAVSWLFGREYSEGTVKDLLSLPISRAKILNAKFVYYIIWCSALIISNLILGLIIGFLLHIPGWSTTVFLNNIQIYLITSILVIILNLLIAFFAVAGKGYLAPLGIVALLLVLAQIIGAIGLGTYFPWSVPGIYSGSGGLNFKLDLNYISYLTVIIIGIAGYILTILWWKYSDQIT